MKTCLLIVLSCWIFIAALVFSLVILLNCGGLAFFALCRYCIGCCRCDSRFIFGKRGM